MKKVHKINGFVYVTSDDKIKFAWINLDNNNVYNNSNLLQFAKNAPSCKSIILCNDTNLTTVQQLTPQEVDYLNGVDECDAEVEVATLRKSSGYYDEKNIWHWDFLAYKIIIPKQETIEEMAEEYARYKNSQNINNDRYSAFLDGYNYALKTLYTAQQVTEYAYYFEKCYAERPMKKPLSPTDYFNQNKKK